MAAFPIGEVEALLGLPASTLRHWERVLPVLDPRKDLSGRRLYSISDLLLLLRLRHLVQRRGLPLAAAGEALLAELAGPDPELAARLRGLRGELVALWGESRAALRDLERRLPAASARDRAPL